MKSLKKFLDDVFSLYIRLRDTDIDGYGMCITCYKINHFKKMDCGHYVKRQYSATRYEEMNCALQCKRCNAFEQGMDRVFAKNIDKRYGKYSADGLELKKHNRTDLSKPILGYLIVHYQRKIEDLMKNKNFELGKHYKRLLKRVSC